MSLSYHSSSLWQSIAKGNCTEADMLTTIVSITLEDGLAHSYLKLPAAISWAFGRVPRIVYNLNSAAFAFTFLLMLLMSPIALITAAQCIWAVAKIGKARKMLSTTFLLLLWPFVVALVSVALAALWALLGLGVVAFIWLLPLAIISSALWHGLSSAAEWQSDQRRIALRSVDEVADITFIELGLALLVACACAFTIAPTVAAVAVLKSPIVFICVTLRCTYEICKVLFRMVREACWTALFALPAFVLALAGVVVVVGIGTAFSILVKIVGAVLWPAYVACGMLRSLGARRQGGRSCGTILMQSRQAAYQVLWFSDIITNAAILMRADLVSEAMRQLTDVAAGTRHDLSADVRSVSCLPPVVIGVLRDDGAWRLDVAWLARALHVDANVLEEAWTSFFQQMNAVGERMIDRQLLTADYLSECPPALLIGLPSLVVLAALERSPAGKEEVYLAKEGLRISHTNRPRGTPFAEEAWKLLLQAKTAREAALPLQPDSYAALEACLLAGGAPSSELPPLLAAAIADGEAGLPPPLSALHKPLYALVYMMAQQHVFKEHFTRSVYSNLVEYAPGRGGTPPSSASAPLLNSAFPL